MKKVFLGVLFIPIMFVSVWFLHQFLQAFYGVTDAVFSNMLFQFTSILSGLVFFNIIIFQLIKPKIVGFVFLAWSMLKIMLVMAYFVFFIMQKNIHLANSTIYEFVTIYMIYLFFEVIFTVFILNQKSSKVNKIF